MKKKNEDPSLFTPEQLGQTTLAAAEDSSFHEERETAKRAEAGKQIKSISSYNDYRDARFHQNLIKFGRLASLNPLPIRLLMMLTQTVATINPDEVTATVFDFSTSAVMKYLKIDKNSGTRYSDLLKATSEFRKAGIDFSEEQQNGGKDYTSINFVGGIRFADYDDILRITVNPAAVDYLIALHNYVSAKPKYFTQLSSTHQMCLYLLLKSKTFKKPEWVIDWKLLKKDLKITDYDPKENGKFAWKNFYTRVLGLSKPKKEDLFIAPGIPARWGYAKDREGNPTGTLFVINKYTDITVSAYCTSEGMIHFFVSKKDKESLELVPTKKRRSKKLETSFESSGTLYPQEDAPIGEKVYNYSELMKMAEGFGVSKDELIKRCRLVPVGTGLWKKKQ